MMSAGCFQLTTHVDNQHRKTVLSDLHEHGQAIVCRTVVNNRNYMGNRDADVDRCGLCDR